ncbi:MAG: glycosyltransferase family 4 protein, partial [Bacteroidota bacterium]
KVIAVSDLVYQYLQSNFAINAEKLELVYEFPNEKVLERKSANASSLFSIPQNAFLIGGCGTIDWRKGTDLFIQVAKKVISVNQEIHFLWLGGNLEYKTYLQIEQDLRKLELTANVHFVGSQSNPQDYFERFDLFLMTSREDPFPLVCLENAQLGNPIICFEGATGSEIYINDETGKVVPYMDTQAMANAVLHYYKNQDLLQAAGEKIKQAVSDYTIEKSGQQILNILKELKVKTV